MTYPLIESVGVVVFNKDKVLLVRHGKASNYSNKIYGIPAGKIEKGETAAEAASREFQEETGLISSVEGLLKLPKSYQAEIEQKDGIKIFNWYVFLCTKHEGVLKTTEETEPFWVNIKDLDNFKLLPNVKEAILAAKLIK